MDSGYGEGCGRKEDWVGLGERVGCGIVFFPSLLFSRHRILLTLDFSLPFPSHPFSFSFLLHILSLVTSSLLLLLLLFSLS